MFKCPKCGKSGDEVECIEVEYSEDGDTLTVVRTYACECGALFVTARYFHSDDNEEVV